MAHANQIERTSAMSSVEDHRSVAFSIIKARSFRRGTFKLASGKMSDFYLDMKPSMFHPKGAWALSNLLFDRLKGSGIEAVGGLEMGAVPLITTVSLVSHLRGQPLPGFFVRKTVKEHGTKKLVEGVTDNSEIVGKRVAIVDDVTTTGQSAMIAVDAAIAAGARVSLVISVVDRQEGASEFYQSRDLPFVSLFTRDEFMRAA